MPISRVLSVTDTSMMFMITMPPTTSEIAAMAIMAMKNVPLRFDQMLRKLALVSAAKLSGLPGQIVAPGPQNGAGLVDGGVQLRAHAVGLARNTNAGVRSELLQISGDRDRHVVVAALAQRGSLLLAHANDPVHLALDANLLAQRIHGGKKIVHDVGANHAHLRTVFLIVFVEHAAGGEIEIKNRRHRGSQPPYPGVGDGLLLVSYVPAGVDGRSPNHGAVLAGLEHRLVVLHGQVFALLAFEKLVNVGDDGSHFADDENISAQIEDLLRHVAVDSVDEGDHGDHGSHADHHAQQGQGRAKLVRPQRQERDADGFKGGHGAVVGRRSSASDVGQTPIRKLHVSLAEQECRRVESKSAAKPR